MAAGLLGLMIQSEVIPNGIEFVARKPTPTYLHSTLLPQAPTPTLPPSSLDLVFYFGGPSLQILYTYPYGTGLMDQALFMYAAIEFGDSIGKDETAVRILPPPLAGACQMEVFYKGTAKSEHGHFFGDQQQRQRVAVSKQRVATHRNAEGGRSAVQSSSAPTLHPLQGQLDDRCCWREREGGRTSSNPGTETPQTQVPLSMVRVEQQQASSRPAAALDHGGRRLHRDPTMKWREATRRPWRISQDEEEDKEQEGTALQPAARSGSFPT
ncbi:hypothetical protein CORC01_08311 [Colletotrichum orchidophilum]|uniref:Uncharacterized protein n=1 Tax=Colletotrichum orchidophilum TaxID=1209926 RepID=A0A1G4B4L9_9PEZI|nr:uncharacterized protein CORC01_08311 [Colletotrichum orchidophilum]OHE96388.1 hypothetical protein CORC01_08311 [Colletotrichum orchidophilum]